MAIASFLSYTDASLQPGGVNRISAAQPADVAFYDRAAYKRLQQVYPTGDTMNNNGPDQDYMLTTTYFPKASIEMLVMFEFGWWPLYVERTLGAFYYKQSNQNPGLTVTAFNPAQLVKVNQTLVRLEVFKAVEIFYSSLVTDNSNINEKDAKNYDFARKRFEEEWEKAIQESYFYDLRQLGEIGTYQQSWLADVNFFEGDRRYF
jgi:hypothetical protein